MEKNIIINGKETELRFVYSDGGYAYYPTWKEMIETWGKGYGSYDYADRHFRETAYGTIVAGSIGHSVPLVSAEHSGVCSAAEKKALFEKAMAFNGMSSIEIANNYYGIK